MALAPLIKPAWAIRRVGVDFAPVFAGYAAPPTLAGIAVTTVTPAGLTAAGAGIVGERAVLLLQDGAAGADYVVEFEASLGNTEKLAGSLPVRVRERVYVNRRTREASLVAVQLDPDGVELHGVDWRPVIAALDALGEPSAIVAHEWVLDAGLVADGGAVAAGAHQALFSAPGQTGARVAESRVTFANGDRDARAILFEVIEQ